MIHVYTVTSPQHKSPIVPYGHNYVLNTKAQIPCLSKSYIWIFFFQKPKK